jgi:large subunit ribosomal protein L5
MDITIVTSANSDEEARELLAGFGFPFKRQWLEGLFKWLERR